MLVSNHASLGAHSFHVRNAVHRFIGLAWVAGALIARPADFRAQVIESRSGLPIEGAQVSLNRLPADAEPEYSAGSTPFGFVELSGVQPGNYELRVERGGYQARVEPVRFVGTTNQMRVLTLTPVGSERFDIVVEVADVTTGVALRGIPVGLDRFATAQAVAPVETLRQITDADGVALFAGLAGGFYRFRLNSPTDGPANPQWLAYTNATAPPWPAVNRASAVQALLKMVPQEIVVQVRGLDPTGPDPFFDQRALLSGMIVEVTGLDPRDVDTAVLPTRSGLTDEAGKARFTGLPAIPLRVTVKRHGYAQQAVVVHPDPVTGEFPASPWAVNVTLLPTHLFVLLRSPYANTNLLAWVPVRLQGLPGTGTEGIDRSVPLVTGWPADQRAFFNLLLGTYRLSVNGRAQGATDATVTPHFQFEDTVEVLEGVWTDAEAELTVRPAMLRGRLFAADERSSLAGGRGDDDVSNYLPRPQVGIELIEYLPDGNLEVSRRVVTVDTDETGEFTVPVLPGRYGIRIPGMTDYWGSHVSLTESSAAAPGASASQGWPYFEAWPWGGVPPANGTFAPGLPLLLHSGREYGLDLFVRRQVADVMVTGILEARRVDLVLDRSLGSPLVTTPYSDLAEGGGQGTLTSEEDGSLRTEPMLATDLNNTGTAGLRFCNVPPGDYVLRLTHPRYAFTHNAGGGPELAVSIPAWAAPGVLPSVSPRDPSFVAPLTEKQIHGFQAEDSGATTLITLRVSFWDEIGQVYRSPTEVSASSGLYQAASSGDVLFNGSFPEQPFTAYLPVGIDDLVFRAEIETPGQPHDFEVFVGGPEENLESAPQPKHDATLRAVSADDPTFDVPDTTLTFQTPTGPVSFPVTNQTLVGFNGGSPSAANPHWVVAGIDRRLLDAGRPHIEYMVRLKRGVRVSGQVTEAGSGGPLAGARVEVRDRHGRPVPGYVATADAAGEFAFSVPLPAAPYFVDVSRPGFKPWRKRFGPEQFTLSDPLLPGSSAIVAAAALEPLPAPAFAAVSFNRRGGFLSGVSRAGDQDLFNRFRAEEALTLTWTSRMTAASFTYEMDRFDAPDGTPRGTQTLEV